MRKKCLCFGVVILVIFGLLSVYVNKKEEIPQERSLHLALRDDVRSLDPRIGIDNPTCSIVRMLFEGLMREVADNEIVPAIAERVEIFQDRCFYTVYLRPAKWSDGHEVTAYDFEYAWRSSIDPKSLAIRQGAFYFYVIKNAEECVLGTASPDSVGIKVLDDKTFTVELKHPAPYFLELVSTLPFSPVPKHLAEHNPNWAEEGRLVSNGPFSIENYELGNRIVLKKNKEYWDRSHVFLPQIQIDIIRDDTSSFLLFKEGKIDWIGSPFTDFYSEWVEELLKEETLEIKPAASLLWLFVNTKRFPLDNPSLRKALSYAINREDIIGLYSYGLPKMPGAVPTTSPLPNTISLCGGLSKISPKGDFTIANRYLQEALDTLGISKKELPPVILSYTSGIEIVHQIAQIVKTQWEKELGISCELQVSDWITHYDGVSKGNYQIGCMGWNAAINDPIMMLQLFKNGNDQINKSNWDHPVFRSLLNQADRELDLEKRRALLTKAEMLLGDDIAVIPLCSPYKGTVEKRIV